MTRAEQVRLAQRMETIGRLSSGLAHDFNNLLTAILGQCDLLLRRLPEGEPARKGIEETPEQDIALTEDRREQVVEIVRQAAREPADRLHPLSQPDLLCASRSSAPE